MKELIQALQEKFSSVIKEISEFKGETTILLESEGIHSICLELHQKHNFTYCADICGADRFTEDERFEIIYNLFNLQSNLRLRLKTRVSEENPEVQSVTDVWKAADWHERETFDMYGIRFLNHPDLRRMYMPEDFEYYPLRKDFPLIGVPGSIPLPDIDDRSQNKQAAARYNNADRI